MRRAPRCSLLGCQLGSASRRPRSNSTHTQDFELAGHHIPKGTHMQCSLAQPLLTDARWV